MNSGGDILQAGPGDMTPDERMNRVIKILTGAVVNIILSGDKFLKEVSGNDRAVFNSITSDDLFPPRFAHEQGPALFGYIETANGQFINDARNSTLKIIREMTKGKKSVGQIMERLNAAGYRTKRGKKWSKSSIWRFQSRYLRPETNPPKDAPT